MIRDSAHSRHKVLAPGRNQAQKSRQRGGFYKALIVLLTGSAQPCELWADDVG
jgi:hypothetical protein